MLNSFLSILLLAYLNSSWSQTIKVRGHDDSSRFSPTPPQSAKIQSHYDVTIIGGGLAGLMAAIYAADAKLKVVVLEDDSYFGEKAFGGELEKKFRYARGIPTWTIVNEESKKLLRRAGINETDIKYKIQPPANAYIYNSKPYFNVWDFETLKSLPAAFEVFKFELHQADHNKLIPHQPIEESLRLELDDLTALEWIKSMPATLATRKDLSSKKLYERYHKDSNKMNPVIDFLEQYSKVHFGYNLKDISALSLANLVIHEFEEHFSSDIGAGAIAEDLLIEVHEKQNLIRLENNITIHNIESTNTETITSFTKDKKFYKIKSKYAVFAKPLFMAPTLIKNIQSEDPKRVNAIKNLNYSHLTVFNTLVHNHPYRQTFATWFGTNVDFPLMVTARWMDPKIEGYLKQQDFKESPNDEYSMLTLYQPVVAQKIPGKFTKSAIEKNAKKIQTLLTTNLGTELKKYNQEIKIASIEANMWPYYTHSLPPKFFKEQAKILRTHFGRIYFASPEIGTPTITEELYRSHCAINNILARDRLNYHQESWSTCPIDR